MIDIFKYRGDFEEGRVSREFTASVNNRERTISIDPFVLVELPEIPNPSEIEIRRMAQDLLVNRFWSSSNVSTKERLIGDQFTNELRNKLLNNVMEKHSQLNPNTMRLYFELLLKGRINPWDFGGVVAVEKRTSRYTAVTNRMGMNFDQANSFISQNTEGILDRIFLDNPEITELDLRLTSVGIPTLAEMLLLDSLNPKISCPFPVLTSTQVTLGMTEKVNLIWRPNAYVDQEISCTRPNEVEPGTEFIVIARFTKKTNLFDS